MAKKSAAQLQDEIYAAIAKGAPHPEATVADWKRFISEIQRKARTTSGSEERSLLKRQFEAANDGLRAAQKIAAHKPTFVTGTNLFALKEMVVKYGPEFSSRVPAVDAPHLKRTLQAGLVEVVGSNARLTETGRQAVADALVQDITRESRWQPRENALVPPEKRAEILARDIAARDAKIERLETTLAKIR